MVCWLCPSLSFPLTSKVVVVGVCVFVSSRVFVVKCTCDAVLGRGGRPYNPVHFQSGSRGHCVGVAIGGSWNMGDAISSVLVGIDSFSTY